MILDASVAAALADAVLVLHVGVAAFVVAGLVLTIWGNLRGWPWVNRLWFRVAHLSAILVVVAEAWAGVVCPLTTLEMWLRVQSGGGAAYRGGFIEHWLQQLLFYDAPSWVFLVGYSVFGGMVAATWWIFPPVHGRERRPSARPSASRTP